MNNIRISDLLQITAEDLLDHDLLVISQEHLERDEDGEMVLKRTVALPLSELKRYLNGSHIPPVEPSSGFTKETLKQTLDDAKAVQETAKRNAMIVMEEVFRKNIGE